MLCRHLMVRTNYRPLKQAPDAFDAVGMNVATDPFFFAVIDRFVGGIVVLNATVGVPVVRHDSSGFWRCVLADKPVERLPVSPLLDSQPDLAATLDRAKHESLPDPIALPDAPPMATDVRLVHFDSSLERNRVRFLHRLPNTMTEIPGGFIGNTERSLELVCRDPLSRFAHQIDGGKPLRKRQVGIVEDASSGDAELVAA